MACHRDPSWDRSSSSFTPLMSSLLPHHLVLKLTTIIYADNSQLYLHCLAIDQSTDALRLAECIEKVERWIKSNWLKLNSDKAQFLWLGSRWIQQLTMINTKTMTFGGHYRIFDFHQESRCDI